MANNSDNFTLTGLNSLMFDFNKPVVVFVTLFMLFGAVGNSLVIYVYMFRMKSTTLKVFIIYLGFVDMLGCCLGMPLEIVNRILPVMYPWNFLCKAHHSIIIYSCSASILTLIAIAGERYNRVCRPLGRQASTTLAKRIVLGVTLVSVIFSIPTCLAYRKEKTYFENGVVAYVCWSDFPSYWTIYIAILFSCFWIFLIAIFALYFFIWRSARQHFQQLEVRRQNNHKDEADHQLTNSNHETKHKSSQVNITIISITTLYAISFAPHFILNMVRPEITDKNYAFIKILHQFWVLNSSLNPLVYGICSGEFRQEFQRLFLTENSKKSTGNTKKTNEMELSP